MKTVLWISRHQMTPPQERDLEMVLGEPIRLVQYPHTVAGISQLIPELQQAQVICAVLPPELLGQLVEAAEGKPVLRAVAGRVPTGRLLTTADGRQEPEFAFIHQGWEQVLRMDIETRMLSSGPGEK